MTKKDKRDFLINWMKSFTFNNVDEDIIDCIDEFLNGEKGVHEYRPKNQHSIPIWKIKAKLIELCPDIKNEKLTNPFVYRDVMNWYEELNNE